MTRIEIHFDDTAQNPREWDNLGTMVYAHRRYTLGDESLTGDARNIEEAFEIHLKEKGLKLKDVICIPTYLYDHSGITMRTFPYTCRWDSGQVGFIYVSKYKVREEFGWKAISYQREERIKEMLEGEVQTFDQYISGEVYGFKLFDGDEETDSCWGFFGPVETNGILENIPEELHEQALNAEIIVTY